MKLIKIFIKKYSSIFISTVLISAIPMFVTGAWGSLNTADYKDIIDGHPRVFINIDNKQISSKKAHGLLLDMLNRLIKSNHSKIPGKMENIKDYIYKEAYLYQMTGDKRWADYAVNAMEQVPSWLKAYGSREDSSYGYAIEALSIGFDWCYDRIVELGKKEYFISLINSYFKYNQDTINTLPEFHNYAAQAEFAVLIAGLATYGDNSEAIGYLNTARDIFENGQNRNGIFFKVTDAINFVDGTCNWEGATYGRRQLFNYIKYAEAMRTATNNKVNPWLESFSKLENAGYYIIYSVRPDNLFENIDDVSYPGISYYDINNLAVLQARFNNGYFTTFLNKYYRWRSGEFQTNIWLGPGNASLVYYLLWYDPKVKEKDLEELPKAMKFGDTVIMRTGFGEKDTFISFKSGIHWGFHSHLDHGSFTIYKNSPLAIDSGYYDSWSSGKAHNWDYWKRTVAHNTLLVYDPNEKWPAYPKMDRRKNDGGQRMAFMTFSPPHNWPGSTNNLLSIDDLNKRLEEFMMGKINNYEFNKEYDYIKTDITKAYNNNYSGIGTNQPKKVNLIEREFVYLRPDFIVIFDRINAVDSRFSKRWLLHSGSYYDKSGKPEFNGQSKFISGNEEAGITESQDTDVIKITRGTGKLFVRTLLPESHLTRRIGGAGFEFLVEGKNVPISIADIPKERKAEDPGAWRIEIQPSQQQNNDLFLNVLYPCENSVPAMPKITKIEASSGNMIGAYITSEKNNTNYAVLFSKTGDIIKNAEFSIIGTGKTKVLLSGIQFFPKDGVWKNGELLTNVSSTQGTVYFETNLDKESIFSVHQEISQ